MDGLRPISETFHKFYCKFIDTKILRQHHLTHDTTWMKNNNNDLTQRAIFHHHKLLDNKMNDTFTKRYNKLLKLIQTETNIHFVYTNHYNTDIDDIIKFSNYLKKI